MKSDKDKVIAEVTRYIRQKDALTERVRAKAEEEFRINPRRALADPQRYLRDLFTVLGTRVVSSAASEAREMAREHGERLQSIKHPDA